MRELRDVVAAWRALPDGGSATLASVVHTAGSTYRRPGARLLVRPDDSVVGLVSGGCLEGDLVERAAAVRGSGGGGPVLVRYDATREDDIVWGLGLGCAGVVEVLLERISRREPGPLAFLAACLEARAPGVLVTGLGGAVAAGARATLAADGAFDPGPWADPGGALGRRADAPPALIEAARRAQAERRTRRVRLPVAAGSADALVEFVPPAPRLLVFGAGPDAGPVVRLAFALGWAVEVVDGRRAFARPERFPEAAAVRLCEPEAVADEIAVDGDTLALVMTHHYLHDRAIVAALLRSPARYLGVLGPRRRTEDLLADLRRDGLAVEDEALERLFAPAGLDLGAEGPEAIALAVVAEMQAVLAGRAGGWLRERKGPIHDPGE